MRVDTLHMTLLFIGRVQRRQLPALAAAAARVRGASFTMELKKFDCWRHNRVGYLAPEKTPSALTALARALRAEVSAAGVEFDRHAFKAHVTVLRNVQQLLTVQAVVPVEWRVDKFALVQSTPTSTGASYRVLQAWPLVSAEEAT